MASKSQSEKFCESAPPTARGQNGAASAPRTGNGARSLRGLYGTATFPALAVRRGAHFPRIQYGAATFPARA